MRILYFSRDYTTHDRRFLSALAETIHSVGYLRLEDDGTPYESRPLPAGIEPLSWHGGVGRVRSVDQCIALMPEFERVIRDFAPDLIHTGPIQTCGFMGALSGVRPLLLMSWGSDLLVDANHDAVHRWMTRFALARADALLCDCDAVRRAAVELAAYPESQIVQFPWGVDLARFAPQASQAAARASLGIGDGFVVLSTRMWEDIYGIETLLEAVRLARTDTPSLRLLLLGVGSRADRVTAYLEKHHLRDVVITPGLVPQEQLPSYFQAADVYLSCARSDGSSISLLEAMATALPVVVTDSASNREWVDAGDGGALACVDDPVSFARQLRAVYDLSAEERQRWGRRNRAVAAARADWPRNFRALLDAYQWLSRASADRVVSMS
jgi:glycosyltransferase involved in cell wall biosynthesis